MDRSTVFRAEKYRYIELFIFILIGVQTQIVWIAFGPAIQLAATYYSVSESYIVILAALFMAAYIPVNYFASKMIDQLGLKYGVGIGVYLTAIGGLVKALAGPQYWICFAGQLIAAIGQPFVLNCWTKLATNWFLESEKTTAAGLGSISQFFGVILAMLFPIDTVGIAGTLWVYAILGIVFTVIYQLFARDHPATPPNNYAIKQQKVNYTAGIREMMTRNRDFQILFIMLFIGLGVFNALTSEIDLIFNVDEYPHTTSGDLGAAILMGGGGRSHCNFYHFG
jgi:MFS family permease